MTFSGVNANVFALVDGGEELCYEVEAILRSTDGSLVTASFARFFHEAHHRQVFGISLPYDTLMKKFAEALDMPQERLTLLSFNVHSELPLAIYSTVATPSTYHVGNPTARYCSTTTAYPSATTSTAAGA